VTALTMLGALGGALETAKEAGIVLFLWLCAALLAGPLIGMALHRSAERDSEPVPEGAIVLRAPEKTTAVMAALDDESGNEK
jgi:hypothetical protein